MRANTYLELSEGASHKFYEVTVEAERSHPRTAALRRLALRL